MKLAQLRNSTRKELVELARKKGVAGYHSMRKDALVSALSALSNGTKKKAKAKSTRATRAPATRTPATRTPATRAPATRASTNGKVKKPKTRRPRKSYQPTKDLSAKAPEGHQKDRIVVMVRDPYWLHAYWEISRGTVERAKAALREDWHAARPILRLLDVSSGDTSPSAEKHVRDIEIHGGVNNWYIDVAQPPRSFRLDVGYLSRDGKFYALAHSNVVRTPKAGVSEVIDEDWAVIQEEFEKIYQMAGKASNRTSGHDIQEMLQDRLRRPLGEESVPAVIPTSPDEPPRKSFQLDVDADLIVYGVTDPSARVSIMAEKVHLREDGTFTVRFGLPDRRQIIPIVAGSPDGREERTIVLAVERNTKELEPMIHDSKP